MQLLSLDDLPSDVPEPPRDELTKHCEKHGFVLPQREWEITFRMDYEAAHPSRWMLA